jgi:hypothetical protein
MAVVPARIRDQSLAARDVRVLVDADLTSWDAGNQFARDFAEATGARVVKIDDGGITGQGFHDRCRKMSVPVLQAPKRHAVPLPAGLRTRPVRDPTPLWCWSLVTRAGDDRPAVLALRENAEKVTSAAGLHASPGIAVHPPTRSMTHLNYRLYRRVIEIRDGLLALRSYRDPEVRIGARRCGAAAGLTGDELRAAVAAAQLRAVLNAKAQGGTNRGRDVRNPGRAGLRRKGSV